MVVRVRAPPQLQTLLRLLKNQIVYHAQEWFIVLFSFFLPSQYYTHEALWEYITIFLINLQ